MGAGNSHARVLPRPPAAATFEALGPDSNTGKLSAADLAVAAKKAGLTFWTEFKLQGLLSLFVQDQEGQVDRAQFEQAVEALRELLDAVQPAESAVTEVAAKSKPHEVDEQALPPKLRAFKPLAKMDDVAECLKPLKALDANLASTTASGDDVKIATAASALEQQLDASKPVVKGAIEERLSAPDVVKGCVEVILEGLDFFEGSYNEIFSTIRKSEGIDAYVQPVQTLQTVAEGGCLQLQSWLRSEHGATPSAMQRTGKIAVLMTDACSSVVLNGFDVTLKAVQDRVPRATSGSDRAPLRSGPLKRSSRILEKVMLRGDDEGNADRVCDVRRALIVVPSMNDFGAALQALADCHTKGLIVIVRVKDRIQSPAAGWCDVMVNFYIAADPHRHVCEVQVAHLKMLTARAGLDGHAVYGRVRNGSEQLEKMWCRPPPENWSLLSTFGEKHGWTMPDVTDGGVLDLFSKELDNGDAIGMSFLWLGSSKAAGLTTVWSAAHPAHPQVVSLS